MFYKMIEKARDLWYSSSDCTINSMIRYIEKNGKMRDAQIEAIKTYLYLKVACDGKPLYKLFSNGTFNTLDLGDIELVSSTREYLENNKPAMALFEYSRLKNDNGEQVSKKLEDILKKSPKEIDCEEFFKDAFYGVSYTDYLFSLPMGAGKTFLMSTFIYLDLYFAKNEPLNPAFAHNFIIFAPSGLKSSVVPSLKTIQKFDPTWILPEPSASEIRRSIKFEVLDQGNTQNKSNKTKNPNVQKIALYQPLSELFGLVAVTNAEKVILDRIEEKGGQINLFEDSDDEKDRQANELRNLIGKLPSLSIFIDEVHHAVSDEIKLRTVVNKWAQNNTINSVIGFSGTPYLAKSEKITVTDKLSIATAEITNVVYYYSLKNGIGNFLKTPIVSISNSNDSEHIIANGVRTFFDKYGDLIYDGNLVPKLGIYCGRIEKLEEEVYPVVSRIASEYGYNSDVILKFHKGNKEYPQPLDSQMNFETLDTPLSKIRIILLAQIGKEGWDCKSLTGVVLSHEGACNKNMVLQTTCRCLRQVKKGLPETALIQLNESNAKILADELNKQQHMTLDEFMSGEVSKSTVKRYDRTNYLKLPKIDFYQLKVIYNEIVVEESKPIQQLNVVTEKTEIGDEIIKTTDFSFKVHDISPVEKEYGNIQITFYSWLYMIAKESFGTLQVDDLLIYEDILKVVFDKITYKNDNTIYLSSKFDYKKVNENIRKAFIDKRDFSTIQELIPQESSLLNIKNFTESVQTTKTDDYYPSQELVERIITDDKGKLKLSKKDEDAIEYLTSMGYIDMANKIVRDNSSHPQKNRSFHYLPYHTDSKFEQIFLEQTLAFSDIENLDLEVYYNGDRSLTEFKIKCYKKTNSKFQYIGMYTPDFLIIKRDNDKILKAIIVETKGSAYANDPSFKDKKTFIESEFLKQNNDKFGYSRFDYLYLEDNISESDRINKTHKKIVEFFGGNENAN